MKQWERKKTKELKLKKRVLREKKKTEKEIHNQKIQNNEKAFDDWLKRR